MNESGVLDTAIGPETKSRMFRDAHTLLMHPDFSVKG